MAFMVMKHNYDIEGDIFDRFLGLYLLWLGRVAYLYTLYAQLHNDELHEFRESWGHYSSG
jgi:hypothetical protein